MTGTPVDFHVVQTQCLRDNLNLGGITVRSKETWSTYARHLVLCLF